MMPDFQAPELPSVPVDLIVNCFERTYREVLRPGFFTGIERDARVRFARKVAVVNNVDDVGDVRRFGSALQESGEIDEFVFVSDLLDKALGYVGLTPSGLGPLPFYSNWAFVALSLPGSDYMVHWDAEIRMVRSADWIQPSIALMRSNPQVATANPLWKGGQSAPEFRTRVGDFALGYGFTDQVFLLNRKEFLRPIYKHWVPISMRYPLAHIAPYFEQWVDAYLRKSNRYRATYLPAVYEHPVKEGAGYPAGLRAWAGHIAGRFLVRSFRALPGQHRYFFD